MVEGAGWRGECGKSQRSPGGPLSPPGGVLYGHIPLRGADHPVRPWRDPGRSLHRHHVLPDPSMGQDPGGQGGLWVEGDLEGRGGAERRQP